MSVNKLSVPEKVILTKDQASETEEADGPDKGIEVEDEGREGPIKAKFNNVCSRFGINPNLVFLKLSLFVMYGGKV